MPPTAARAMSMAALSTLLTRSFCQCSSPRMRWGYSSCQRLSRLGCSQSGRRLRVRVRRPGPVASPVHHARSYDAVLGRVLIDVEAEGKAYTLREYRQTCYHVSARRVTRA